MHFKMLAVSPASVQVRPRRWRAAGAGGLGGQEVAWVKGDYCSPHTPRPVLLSGPG